MTVWDNIYKNYQKGGEAWATLSEEIHPLFSKFRDVKLELDEIGRWVAQASK